MFTVNRKPLRYSADNGAEYQFSPGTIFDIVEKLDRKATLRRIDNDHVFGGVTIDADFYLAGTLEEATEFVAGLPKPAWDHPERDGYV